MIDVALNFLTEELNEYLQTAYPTHEAWAVLSSRVSQNALAAAQIENKVSLTLVNLEPESTPSTLSGERLGAGGEVLRINPGISMNLLVLVAANFIDYGESLKFLTATLTFFQGRNVFTPQNSPRLAPAFERLELELVPTSYQDWSFLWGMLGGQYTPGAVYRLRLLTIQDSQAPENTPVIQSIAINS